MQQLKVAVLVGSLRQKSVTRKVAKALTRLAPSGLHFSFIEIGDLPHYNEDLESDPPAAYTRFRSAIVASDALLFVTPEFNRGTPGVLKNSIDVGRARGARACGRANLQPWSVSPTAGSPVLARSTSCAKS